MNTLTSFTEKVHQMVSQSIQTNIKEIDEPLNYFLSMGGKRLRPAIVYLLELWYDRPIPPIHSDSLAKTVEFFHNFSLIHDDIMDRAKLRRGKETIHKKWNQNIGILSGDYLLIDAYKQLENLPNEHLAPIFKLYNQTASEVCIGQQMDMNFEKLTSVSQTEYIEMIRLKTAVLLGFVMAATGQLLGLASSEIEQLYSIGESVGISFQILDDILDTYGDDQVGKTIGGDILQSKKTILYTLTYDTLEPSQQSAFIELYNSNNDSKVEHVLGYMKQANTRQQAQNLADLYSQKAYDLIGQLSLSQNAKEKFSKFVKSLLNRQY